MFNFVNSTLFLLLIFSMNKLQGQSLKTHQWKERLVLLIANDQENKSLQKQLAIFRTDQEGVKERKLFIYQITPGKYKNGITPNTNWEESSTLFKEFRKLNSDFEIILIGLDGGIKLRQEETISNKELFALIDGMPMRRAEIRKNKKSHYQN